MKKLIVAMMSFIVATVSTTVFVPISSAFLGWAGANNSKYIPTNNTQPYDINISRNIGNSKRPCIAIDSHGIPHVVWQDNHETKFGTYEIMYVKWDPVKKNWVGASGSVYDPSVEPEDQPADINVSYNIKDSVMPKIVLDTNDRPHIVWVDETGNDADIFYVYWEPGLPSGPGWARSDHIKYNGSNADVCLNTGTSCQPTFDLDSNNIPFIAWTDTEYGNAEILCVKWDETNHRWACVDGSEYKANGPFCHGIVSNNSGLSVEPSLKIDKSTNMPHLAWADQSYQTNSKTNYEIMYARWNGTSWVGANGSAYDASTGANANMSNNIGDSRTPSLDLDSNGRPHIAWQEATCTVGIGEILYVRWNGNNWVGANGNIYNPANCANSMVSDSSAGSKHPKLILDSKNDPHLVWYVNTNDGVSEIIYTYWKPSLSSWYYPDGDQYTNTNSNVSKNKGSSLFPCLALDSSDAPHIVWEDRSYPLGNECPEKNIGNKEVISQKSLSDSPNSVMAPPRFDCGNEEDEDESCSTQNKFETMYVHWHDAFTGTFTFTKGVDTDDDGIYDDTGETVYFGTTIHFKLSWIFENPNGENLVDAYVFDVVPNGTEYVQGAVPVTSMSYSLDGGVNWVPGEPADGTPAGTVLRWFIADGTTSIDIFFSAKLLAGEDTIQIENKGSFTHSQDESISIYTNTVYVVGEKDPDDGGGDDGGDGGGGSSGGTPRPYTVNLIKSVDVNGDGSFDDCGKKVNSGSTITYQINWKMDNPDDVPVGGFIYDTVPQDTFYVGGSATQSGLAYSPNGSSSWIWGDPPHLAPGGTKLRWNAGLKWVGTENMFFDPKKSTQPKEINISEDIWSSEDPSIAIDSKGVPHLCWACKVNGNFDIYYVKWDHIKLQWVGANGSIYIPGNAIQPLDINISRNPLDSKKPSLVLDSNDMPYVAWEENSYSSQYKDVFYMHWNDTIKDWVGAGNSVYNPGGGQPLDINVSRNSNYSVSPQLRLDSFGIPNIVWSDASYLNEEIMYVKWDQSIMNWVGAAGSIYNPAGIQPLDINVSRNTCHSFNPSFELYQNLPHIAWTDNTCVEYGDIYYVSWSAIVGNWVTAGGATFNPLVGNANVSRNSGYSDQASLDIGSDGRPHIAWTDDTYGLAGIFYVEYNPGYGNWMGANGSVYWPLASVQPFDIEASRTLAASVQPNLKLDSANRPYITWMDYSLSANYGDTIVFVKWDNANSKWVGADNSPYITGANHHKNSPGVIVSKSSGFTRAPMMQIDSTGMPHLTWFDNNYGGIYAIMYVTLGVPTEQTFQFQAKIGYSLRDKTICNMAYFAGNTTNGSATSNECCIIATISENQPIIEVVKRARKSQAFSNEFIVYTITVRNSGKLPSTDVTLYDVFPNNLQFVSSRPTGVIYTTRAIFIVGVLSPGESRQYELVFKLKPGTVVPSSGLVITNIATATSKELEPVIDQASVLILPKEVSSKELYLWTSWKGIDLKTNEGKIGGEIELSYKPQGGVSPYDVMVDWGDGSPKTATNGLDGESVTTVKHAYQTPGDYEVLIKCVDFQARTTIVRRKLHIK